MDTQHKAETIIEENTQEEFKTLPPVHSILNKGRFTANAVSIERRSTSNTVFHVDDTPFQSTTPAATHWSVAWSDLMMTMFVLFLSMFVYQMAHDDFLEPIRQEVIGGDTTEALQSTDASGASFPFAPISPSLPLMTAGTIKKVERVPIEEFEEITVPVEIPAPTEVAEPEKEISLNPAIPTTVTNSLAIIIEQGEDIPPPLSQQPLPIPGDTILEPRPLITEAPEPVPMAPSTDHMQNIFRLSQEALEQNDLSKFATVDLVPDQTMRIILTGDLLFSLGNSELSKSAENSLYALATVLRDTPYMINVVGHTDNIPMASSRYPSNWELSVARASSVARFLIHEIDMNPAQFVVSGYSSYRPVAPNSSADSRAKNRRVEIIISKRLPKPLPATPENLDSL
ncbi:OmpA family protein [Desulforhopalus sp. 52FAK]